MKPVITQLPFNAFLGIEPGGKPSQLLRLPAAAHYLNHLGTVHASAQLALAEASSGEFLLRNLASADTVVPVVRRVNAKFRQPAHGALVSTGSAPAGALEYAAAQLAQKRRAVISVTVQVYDESGAQTLSAEIDWFLQRQ